MSRAKLSSIPTIKWFWNWQIETMRNNIHDVVFNASLQGTAKTTSMLYDFAQQPEALFIAQSRKKLESLSQQITDFGYSKRHHIIYTLEDICETITEAKEAKNEELLNEVSEFRKSGIPPDRIHVFICKKHSCRYREWKNEIKDLSLLSFDGAIVRMKYDKQTRGNLLGKPKKIFIDESDGFLSSEEITFHQEDIAEQLTGSKFMKLTGQTNFIQLFAIRNDLAFETFKEEFKELTASENQVIENLSRVRELHKALELLKTGLIVGTRQVRNKDTGRMDTVFTTSPKILSIFEYILEHPGVRLIAGSAKLNKNVIEREKLHGYFELLKHIKIQVLEQRQLKSRSGDEFNSLRERIYQMEKQTLEVVRAPNPKGKTQVYSLSINEHGFSMSRYTGRNGESLFGSKIKSRSKEQDEKIRKLLFDEIGWYAKYALDVAKKIYGVDVNPRDVLFISYNAITRELERLKKKDKRNYRHFIYNFQVVGGFFSNAMHGINADKLGVKLIIVYGDPIDRQVVEYAQKFKVNEDYKKMRRGFALKRDADKAFRDILVPSMLSEVFEAIHRARGTVIPDQGVKDKIPVIVIGNLLDPDNAQDRIIVDSLLKQDGIELHSLNDRETRKAYMKSKVKIELVDEKEVLEPNFDDFTKK